MDEGPLRVGLTGSIGMGKTETAKMFAALGVPVYNADAVVHSLYEVCGEAVEPVGAAFPGVVREGRVDRAALMAALQKIPDGFAKLEAIVHPLAAIKQQEFLAEHAAAELIVFDIPLLFETGGEKQMDVVVVVSASAEQQQARAMARPGMTAEKFTQILTRQIPDAGKRARADYVVDTGQGFAHAEAQVRKIVEALRLRKSHA